MTGERSVKTPPAFADTDARIAPGAGKVTSVAKNNVAVKLRVRLMSIPHTGETQGTMVCLYGFISLCLVDTGDLISPEEASTLPPLPEDPVHDDTQNSHQEQCQNKDDIILCICPECIEHL